MSRLPVKLTEHGTKVTFATTCLHNGIVVDTKTSKIRYGYELQPTIKLTLSHVLSVLVAFIYEEVSRIYCNRDFLKCFEGRMYIVTGVCVFLTKADNTENLGRQCLFIARSLLSRIADELVVLLLQNDGRHDD